MGKLPPMVVTKQGTVMPPMAISLTAILPPPSLLLLRKMENSRLLMEKNSPILRRAIFMVGLPRTLMRGNVVRYSLSM